MQPLHLSKVFQRYLYKKDMPEEFQQKKRILINHFLRKCIFKLEVFVDQIASLLKKVPKNQILIEGHTARVGDESDEMQLSLDRAHTIVAEMTKRGVNTGNFITKGSGGTKPVADNETPEGRARNRRVEITILTRKN